MRRASIVGRSLTFLFGHWRPQAEDEDNSFILTSETNMATISNLSPGKIYAFQVRARTAVGYGPYSGKMYFQTLMGGKCYHFVLRSAHNQLSLVYVPEYISLSSGGLLPDVPTQIAFLYNLHMQICSLKDAVRAYCLWYHCIPQSYLLLPLHLWPARVSAELFLGGCYST